MVEEAQRKRIPWGPKEKHAGPTMQSVRVGDRLGVRYRGAGSRFNLTEELQKSKNLGYPTFDAVYVRGNYKKLRQYRKYSPDGTVETVSIVRGLSFYAKNFVEPGSVIDDQSLNRHNWTRDPEIVVIPNFAFFTADLLKMLKSSDINTEVEGVLRSPHAYRVDNTTPKL